MKINILEQVTDEATGAVTWVRRGALETLGAATAAADEIVASTGHAVTVVEMEAGKAVRRIMHLPPKAAS